MCGYTLNDNFGYWDVKFSMEDENFRVLIPVKEKYNRSKVLAKWIAKRIDGKDGYLFFLEKANFKVN